jgi:hypothetical protein
MLPGELIERLQVAVSEDAGRTTRHLPVQEMKYLDQGNATPSVEPNVDMTRWY